MPPKGSSRSDDIHHTMPNGTLCMHQKTSYVKWYTRYLAQEKLRVGWYHAPKDPPGWVTWYPWYHARETHDEMDDTMPRRGSSVARWYHAAKTRGLTKDTVPELTTDQMVPISPQEFAASNRQPSGRGKKGHYGWRATIRGWWWWCDPTPHVYLTNT